MFIKICGITRVDEGLVAAESGADAIGLNFFPGSKRFVEVDRARLIMESLPSEVLAVGVFRNQDRRWVFEVADQLGLGAVQLHGSETPDDVRWIGERVPSVIKVFAIDDPALLQPADYGPHRLMIDSPQPGSGETFDWALLNQRAGGRQFVLAGGLNPDNVAEAVVSVRPWGVDVASGVEAEAGGKDPDKVRRFVAAARRANAGLGSGE